MKSCLSFIENHIYFYTNTAENKVLGIRHLQIPWIKFLLPGLERSKMKPICIAVSMVFILSTISIAQVATIMLKPSKYEDQPDGDLIEGKAKYSHKLWLVFSDRDNNNAYGSPSEGAPILNTAGYMDKFYVVGESGDFLELYKWKDEPGMKTTGSKGITQLNPNKAEKIGWIKKQNLLLWSKCLVDKQTGFSEKAIAVVSSKNLDREIEDGSVRIYGSPDGHKENSDTTIKIFSFLYIYKRSGSRVLIGKTSKTQQYNADRDILGWIDSAFLEFWPGRLCLDVNHEAEAVKARKEANVKASLFYSEDEALTWKEGNASNQQLAWDDDSYERALRPNQLRFPVFDRVEIGNNVLIKTGFFTSILTEDTVAPVQVNTMVKNYLSRFDGALNNLDSITKFNGRNLQFFIPAWTVENVNKVEDDKPVFKYVLYLTDEELSDLINHLSELTPEDASPSDLRNKLYETYESLAQVYFRKEIADDKKFKRKITLAQIIDRITGLPSKSTLLKDVKFTDIKDRAKVSDDKITEIVNRIRNSYEALKDAKNDIKNEIRYPTEDGAFYWISQNYLP